MQTKAKIGEIENMYSPNSKSKKLILTKEEVIKGLEKIAEDILNKREAVGIEGESPEYLILVNALALLD